MYFVSYIMKALKAMQAIGSFSFSLIILMGVILGVIDLAGNAYIRSACHQQPDSTFVCRV